MAEEFINVTSWTNFMRGLWSLAPNKLFTAKIVVGTTDQMLGTLAQMRAKLNDLDLLWPEAAMRSWDRDLERVKKRYVPMRVAIATDPTDATATLVVPQILYPTKWTQEDGVERTSVLLNDIGSLYNQLHVQFQHHKELFGSYGPNIVIYDWITEAKREIAENAAPGEEPTVRDYVEDAGRHVARFVKRVGSAVSTSIDVLPWVAGGLVVAGAAYLLAKWPRRRSPKENPPLLPRT